MYCLCKCLQLQVAAFCVCVGVGDGGGVGGLLFPRQHNVRFFQIPSADNEFEIV